MSDFVPVCKVADLPEGGKMVVEVDDRIVALFRVDGNFYALDDVCTHDGGTLADGQLQGHTIACPRHGAQFDIRDGRVLSMPATSNTVAHQVKVEGNDVSISSGKHSGPTQPNCRVQWHRRNFSAPCAHLVQWFIQQVVSRAHQRPPLWLRLQAAPGRSDRS